MISSKYNNISKKDIQGVYKDHTCERLYFEYSKFREFLGHYLNITGYFEINLKQEAVRLWNDFGCKNTFIVHLDKR